MSYLLEITKCCTKCRRRQSVIKFYGTKSHCKECHKFLVRRWQKKNPDSVQEYKRKYNEKQQQQNQEQL